MNIKTWNMLLGTLLLLVPILILIVYALVIIRMVWPVQELSIEHLGSFGDTFGIITALFTALAFGGVNRPQNSRHLSA